MAYSVHAALLCCGMPWLLAGVRRLGEWHVQLLCSPELPPELLEAKQAQGLKRLTAPQQQQTDSPQNLDQSTASQTPGGGKSTAATLTATPTAATTSKPAALRQGRSSAAAIAAAVRSSVKVAAQEALTGGHHQAVLQQMARAVSIPMSFVDASMPGENLVSIQSTYSL
jgi:hypothetical protein